MGIRAKMIVLIALPTLAVYLTVLGLMLAHLSSSNRADVQKRTAEQAALSADRFNDAFERAATVARLTARMMENAPDLGEEQIVRQLYDNVREDAAIYGCAVAFEPGAFRPGTELVAPYVFRKHGEGALQAMNIGRDVYDWYADPAWQWWHLPKNSGAAAWTDPYFDKGAGNVLMVTYSVPFFRQGSFRGVATVDIQVSKIREHVGAEIVGDTEFVILSRKGEFVSSPREHDVMTGRTVFDVMDAAAKEGRPEVAAACRAALTGESGVADIPAWPGDPPSGWERWSSRSWLAYAPIKSTGWVFASMVPEGVALGPARARTIEAAVALAVALVLMIVCIFFVSSLVTRRVSHMAEAVRRIATGNFDHKLPVTNHDELGHLSHSVNAMARDLKRHTEEMSRARSRSREAMIFALAKLAESRDDDTGKHLERICLYVDVLASAVAKNDPALDAEWKRTVTVTAALHDIGKVGIPDAILKKPGPLTDAERRRMQSHTTIGGDTLIAVRNEWTEDDFLRIAAEIALGHHEKWDGTGYPYGLAAEEISLSARIVAVADVYDALTSKRVYKPAMSHDEAARLIKEGSGRHFDPRVVEAFFSVEVRIREIAAAHSS
jgi:response regulator RpfG family c-di-GMP phosphodiesterase